MSKRKRESPREDSRFKHVATSKKFRPISKRTKTFAVDSRFKDINTEKFTTIADMDRYGRPIDTKHVKQVRVQESLSSKSSTSEEEEISAQGII